MRGQIPRWNGQGQQYGGFTASFSGPWATAAATPTAGTSFVLPAGVFRGVCNATGFSATQTGIVIEVYFDGVLLGTMRLNSAHPTGVHTALSSLTFSQAVGAGTHYIYFRQTAGSSDGGDLGSVLGVLTPS